MFLYTKYFLIFLSISALSPICAMDADILNEIFSYEMLELVQGPLRELHEFASIQRLQRPRVENFVFDLNSKFELKLEEGFKKLCNEQLEKEEEKQQLKNIKSRLQEGLGVDHGFIIGSLKAPIICAAAEHNDVELVKLLLERGADINAADGIGDTALHKSIETGNDFLREYLLQKGANPNPPSREITPLKLAMIYYGDASAIKSLIQYGANIEIDTVKTFIESTLQNFNFKKEYCPYIKTVLLILKKYNKVLYDNHDLRFLILSYLPEYHCHPGLYKELYNKKYVLKPFDLHVVDGHTKIFQEILHTKNKDNKNILELHPLIKELNEKLVSDAAEFKRKYPNTLLLKQGNLALELVSNYKYKSLIQEDMLAPKEIMEEVD